MTITVEDLWGARCVGQHELFDSEEPEDHARAKKECALCPVVEACEQRLAEAKAKVPHELRRHGGPEGTWAGKRRSWDAQYCGTSSGVQKHRMKKEALCDECQVYDDANRPDCGTYSGASAHRRRGEEVCEPCLAAETAHRQWYEQTPARQAVHQRYKARRKELERQKREAAA